MKLAGWLVPEGRPYQGEAGAVQDFRLRVWHPSFLPALWSWLDVTPASAKPLVIALAWAKILWRTRHR